MSLCRSADININCDSRHSLKKNQHNSIYHWLSVMFKPLFFYKCSFLQGGGRPWIQKAQRWKPPNPVFHLSISVPNLQLSTAQYLNDVWGWAKATPRTRDNLHRGKIWENKHAATKHYQIPMEFIGCSLKVNIRLLGGGGCQCLCRLSAGLSSAQAQWHFSSGVFEQPSAECSQAAQSQDYTYNDPFSFSY